MTPAVQILAAAGAVALAVAALIVLPTRGRHRRRRWRRTRPQPPVPAPAAHAPAVDIEARVSAAVQAEVGKVVQALGFVIEQLQIPAREPAEPRGMLRQAFRRAGIDTGVIRRVS